MLIASTARRRVAFWIWAWPVDLRVVKCSSVIVDVGARKRTVEDWFTQACKGKELGPWAAGSRN